MNLAAAFASAQKSLAVAQGMAADAAGNFLGPDGQTYTMTFRAADAFESAAASREMTMHGYEDRSVAIATATRAQFAAAPLDWRRKHGTRLIPAPSADALISSISTDDPHHYAFTMLLRYPVAPGS